MTARTNGVLHTEFTYCLFTMEELATPDFPFVFAGRDIGKHDARCLPLLHRELDQIGLSQPFGISKRSEITIRRLIFAN